MAEPGSEALKRLQEELLQLKQRVPGLQLKRTPAGQSATAPFPITVAADVPAPPEAERYDVSGFRLSVRLEAGVLEGQMAGEAVSVEVSSGELPRALRQAIGAELHRLWAASLPAAAGALNLHVLWAEASRHFMHLLTLLPEVLESYQYEDASGSTSRRWAVLSDEASVTVDASVHVPAPAATSRAPAPAATAGSAAAAAGQGQGSTQQHPAAATGAAAGLQDQQPPVPRVLQQELTFLGRRYGLRLLPATTAGAAAVGAQLAGLQLTPAGSAPAPEAAPAAATAAPAGDMSSTPAAAVAAFELELHPTDPTWTPATHPPSLLLYGWASSSYPASGSMALAVSSRQAQLPALHRQVLDRLLAAEVAAGGPRPAPLTAAVRYVANHTGQLWEQAEDIAAEVARRRRQQGRGGKEEAGGQREQRQLRQQGQVPRGADEVGASSSSSSRVHKELGTEDTDEEGTYDSRGTGDTSDKSGSDSDSGAGTDSGSGSEEGEEGAAMVEGGLGASSGGGGGGGGGHSDAVLPLLLQLEGLDLVDCDCLELLRLNLQVSCSRCRASGELSFASAAVELPTDAGKGGGRGSRSGTLAAAGECGTCHAAWQVELAPKLVHDRSNTLAHLRAEGCLPMDVLPSMLAGQCSQCSSSAAFRSVAVGRWNERACSSCHTAMKFQFATALFVPNLRSAGQRGGAAGSGAGGGTARAGRQAGGGSGGDSSAVFNGLLQVGQPLPERGTCPHYKHSYRWLRFPCCGKRFPCDLCHEELTDGHDMKWATRMVCGYCSLEQPVASQCKNAECGKKLATSAAAPTGRRTRFWEGGKGQRDPTKLLPSDPRRHRGRNKTQSAKHKRVGPKQKEKKKEQD